MPTVDITLPQHLRAAISLARNGILDGTIEDITSTHVDVPFTELANGGQWADDVLFNFKCTHCGQIFELAAETYHGSGGWWKPITK